MVISKHFNYPSLKATLASLRGVTNLSCCTSSTVDFTVLAGVDYMVGQTADVGENDHGNEEQVQRKQREV